jgi:acrylyl-CoA reductase (NADPH)
VIDNVGGKILGNVLPSFLCYWGSCAAVGNASPKTGIEFTTTVLPFLLRGINLLGIDKRRRRAAPPARRNAG